MATRGPVSTQVDSALLPAAGTGPLSESVAVGEAQGFRAPVDTTMSLGPARPSAHLTHFAGGLPGHFGPRQQQQQRPSPAQKVSQSHVEVRRRDPAMESRAHPVVTRPVAQQQQQQGKPAAQMMLPHRSPQDKVIQKPAAVAAAAAAVPGMQRAHTRTAGWQTPLGQHTTPGTPSRMFYPHPVTNAQTRSSPQEQGRQHPLVYPPQQLPPGVKSLPIYPVLRTPVAGSQTNNHNDIAYRERPPESPIVVHIGDRKVRLVSESDPSTLYSLCRRWVRNDLPRADRLGVRDVMIALPRPLSVAEVESAGDYALDNGTKSDPDQCHQPEIERPADSMTDEELLQSHIQHFKTVRKRSKEDRMRRIARFKPRLALLLPESG